MSKKRYSIEEQTGHPADPGDVKFKTVATFFHPEIAIRTAKNLAILKQGETDLRVYDSKEERVIWSIC